MRVKFTRYFESMRQRSDRAAIKLEWVRHVIEHPIHEVTQRDGRIRRWAPIEEMDGRHFARGIVARQRDRG